MAQEQADLSAARTYRLGTAAHASAPTDGTTEPDIVLSPQAPGMLPTTGFLFGLKAPSAGSATAAAGGFTVTVWTRNPVLKQWFNWEATTGVDYDELFVTADIDSAELYFQIANVSVAGNVDVSVWEQ
jgi:hypothetical protein